MRKVRLTQRHPDKLHCRFELGSSGSRARIYPGSSGSIWIDLNKISFPSFFNPGGGENCFKVYDVELPGWLGVYFISVV